MVRLEYGLTEEIQSATDMVESGMVPPRCMGLRVVCSAARSHAGIGLNVRSQSAEAGPASCGRFTTVALEELRRFPGMREDQGHGDGGA
jgi:hypothetical protein